MADDLRELPPSSGSPGATNPVARRTGLFVVVALVVGAGLIAALVIGLGALGRANDAPGVAQAPPAAAFSGPSASPTAASRLLQPTASATQRTNSPTGAPPQAALSTTLAAVGDELIGADTARTVLAADRAVGRLLGQASTSDDDLLDRLVNTELVRQAARTAGFSLSDAQVTQALTGFLSAAQQDPGRSHGGVGR